MEDRYARRVRKAQAFVRRRSVAGMNAARAIRHTIRTAAREKAADNGGL